MGDEYEAMRCLFDICTPTQTKQVHVKSIDSDIPIVTAEDEDPGALQSGVFLWAASTFLAEFLAIKYFPSLVQPHVSTTLSSSAPDVPITVCELGAGCGLSGVLYATLCQRLQRPTKMVFTDRDVSLLKHIDETIQLSGLDAVAATAELSWGRAKEAQQSLTTFLKQQPAPFDLVIGSDLIYSTEIVDMLFYTVNQILRHRVDDAPAVQNQDAPRTNCGEEHDQQSCAEDTTSQRLQDDQLPIGHDAPREPDQQHQLSAPIDPSHAAQQQQQHCQTAKQHHFTSGRRPTFILCSSFRHPDTSTLVQQACDKLGLRRRVLYDSLHHSQGDEGQVTETVESLFPNEAFIVEEFVRDIDLSVERETVV